MSRKGISTGAPRLIFVGAAGRSLRGQRHNDRLAPGRCPAEGDRGVRAPPVLRSLNRSRHVVLAGAPATPPPPCTTPPPRRPHRHGRSLWRVPPPSAVPRRWRGIRRHGRRGEGRAPPPPRPPRRAHERRAVGSKPLGVAAAARVVGARGTCARKRLGCGAARRRSAGDSITRRTRPTPRGAGEKSHVPRRQSRDGPRVVTTPNPAIGPHEEEDGHAQRNRHPARAEPPGRGEALEGGQAPLIDGRVDGVGRRAALI